MKQEKITTSKMPGEGEVEYTAWLWYCEVKSIRKLLDQWKKLAEGGSEVAAELEPIVKKLGKPPGERTIMRWSSKYQWVARADLKLAEDLEAMREKSKKIAREKKHKVLALFERVINQVHKQLKERIEAGGQITIAEVKQAWEMATIELGKPISRGALEFEQRPLTPEEKERGRQIDEAIEEILTRKKGRSIQHPLLDTEKQHKKRKGRTD